MKRWTLYTRNLTHNRPFAVLSMMAGARDAIVGLGFIFGLEEIQQTRLFQNFDAFIPHISGAIFGFVFLIVGIFVMVTAGLGKIKLARWGLMIQSYAWFFSMLMYMLHGDFVLALAFGLFFSAPSGYLSFYFKHGKGFREQARAWKGQVDKPG